MRSRRVVLVGGLLLMLAMVVVAIAYGGAIERWLLALHGVRH